MKQEVIGNREIHRLVGGEVARRKTRGIFGRVSDTRNGLIKGHTDPSRVGN